MVFGDRANDAGRPGRRAGAAAVACLACLAAGTAAAGSRSQADDPAKRAAARIQALQREAEELASRERSLLGELRGLELEYELQSSRRQEAERELAAVDAALAALAARIRTLDASASGQQPELAARIVELYKLRSGGYLRLLLNVGSLQEMGRAYRFASAMQELDARRLENYRRTLAELRRSETELVERQSRLARLKTEAAGAAAAASKAASARSALVDRIDARRDMNARLTGELQVARRALQETVERLGSDRRAGTAPIVLPIGPFRGDLDWPVAGKLLSNFGRPRDPRTRASLLNNGIQIGAPIGTEVRAIHDGTVSFAAPFSGFGNLVIVDHGGLAYSLYGQLADLAVSEGARLGRGVVVGTVGASIDGTPALYFELRIDARPVNPLQWLRAR
ncbi:MAG: peptidoglycan DD-metalloendopeptidase family protein [Acidobacteriota bacterium]